MRIFAIAGAALLLLICTAIGSFIAGTVYEHEYQQRRAEREKLDKIINCLGKDGRSDGNKN